ncbi:MAG TPA: PAS domain S-box protein [Flavitalea sp.]|nr:PAS domain S-box protein [Flavitalea sp.]
MSEKHPIPSLLLDSPEQGTAPAGDDITRLQNVEKALRISEERYRSLFESLGEGIVLFDQQENIIAINKSAENIFSVPRDSDLKFSSFDPKYKYFHEDGSEFPPETHPRTLTLKTGNSYNNVVLGMTVGDRPIKWLRINTKPIYYFDTREKPDAVVASFVDITEEIRRSRLIALEKEVLEINAQPAVSLKTIVDYFLRGLEKIFPDMICSVIMLQDNERITHLSSPSMPESYTGALNNSPFQDNLGSCGTAMYRKQNVFTEDIESDPRWEGIRQLAAQHQLKACWSFPILTAKNEALASIGVYHKAVKSPSEIEIAVFEKVKNLLRIIIENKKAESEVRLSNERYMLATKATNDAVWDWDIKKNKLFLGEGFRLHFGYNPDETSRSFAFWVGRVHEADRERVSSSLRAFVDTKSQGLWQEEYRLRNAKGSDVLVFNRGFLVFNQVGEVIRMIGSLQDITEKRGLEKKLLQEEFDRQKLVAQAVVDAQEKERADIGHELHDNVNQILSTARLYLELAKNENPERMALINKSIENIASAINEIRNISRSLVPASIGDIGLVACIEDFVGDIRFTRALNVEFYYEGDIEGIVDSKRKLVTFRIIQEQVTNVLKHAEAKNLVIELMVDSQGIELSISDDGKGFDKESVSNKKGMGLYNIHSRVELFNGKINMLTEPGKGCKLNIYIPV